MALKVEENSAFSVNPRTGEVIADLQFTPSEKISDIFNKAKTSFTDWRSLTFKTRLELLKKAYRQFYQYQDEIASLISAETGKPLVEAYSSEILPVLDCFKYYLKNTKRFLQEQRVGAMNPLMKLRKGVVRYEPLGVIAVISPWNYPFLLSMMHIIPAVLAGNVVVHKPSEHTSLVGLKIREIFDFAYLPKGVLQIVTGLTDVGQALVNLKFDKIIFTGSTSVGRKIYESAARNLVPVNMELGGSDPMIVLEDANFKRAVNAAVWGSFTNSGQACVGVERLFIHESILDKFVVALVGEIRKIRVGINPSETEVTCLATEQQFQKIESFMQDAVKNGAVIHCGGKARKDLGQWCFEPTVLSQVDMSVDSFKQEIFGPVVIVTPFISDDEAVYQANNSAFGLSASIWTENLQRARRMANRIEAGSVLINELHVHAANVNSPYSGFKDSGIGVSHGPWGLMEVVRPKYINQDRPLVQALLRIINKDLIQNDVWWFKYKDSLSEDFRAFSDFLHADSFAKKMKSLPAVIKGLFRKDYLSE